MMILEIAKRALIPWLVDSSGNVLTATAVSATCREEMFGKCLKTSKHPFHHLDNIAFLYYLSFHFTVIILHFILSFHCTSKHFTTFCFSSVNRGFH